MPADIRSFFAPLKPAELPRLPLKPPHALDLPVPWTLNLPAGTTSSNTSLPWVDQTLANSSFSSIWQPSSPRQPDEPDSDNEWQPSANAVRSDEMREKVMRDPDLCREIIRGLPIVVAQQAGFGFCVDCTYRTSKENGYIQVTWAGASHFVCLQELLVWASGHWLDVGDQASHLCANPRCTVVGHVVAEPGILNQRRKGCLSWVECPHNCGKVVRACVHTPQCIRFRPGFSNWEDFRANGFH